MDIRHRGLRTVYSSELVRDLTESGQFKDEEELRTFTVTLLDKEADIELERIDNRKDLSDEEKEFYRLRFGRTSESPQVTTG